MQATKIGPVNPEARGSQILYRLDPPMKVADWEGVEKEYEYVVASAAVVMFTGAETYLFPADEKGNIIDWGELDGSYRGGLDHDAAVEGAGYQVVQ